MNHGEVRTPIERDASRIGQAPPADRKAAGEARNPKDKDAYDRSEGDGDSQGGPRRPREARDPEAPAPRHHPRGEGNSEDPARQRREARNPKDKDAYDRG